MFWISLGLIIASFIGFVILRIENVPEGDTRYDSDVDDPDVDDSDLDDMDYDESEEESNSAPHQEERLRALKYVTFILMFAGLALFVLYAFLTA